MKQLAIFVLAFWFTLGLRPAAAAPDEYDDSQSHPLRILAYLVHPAAFVLEWTVFRPFHYLVSGAEPLEAVFGHRPHPPVLAEPLPPYDYGVPRRAPAKPTATYAAPPRSMQEPAAERVRIVEVPVEKLVVKEIPRVVEVERLTLPEIAFRFNSAELTELGRGEIYLAAQKLKEKSDIVITVEGHADSIGTEEYNQQLGMRRAETVMKELVRLGIEPARMTVFSHGKSKPLIDQDAGWARAVNRRVELHVKAQ
ncbi:MAG TPA: OmpA family protein [Candidatus Eisenbacteria bacterium]|nr:OmpA family protein [Candidatus Eisenbacteria bacterium]